MGEVLSAWTGGGRAPGIQEEGQGNSKEESKVREFDDGRRKIRKKKDGAVHEVEDKRIDVKTRGQIVREFNEYIKKIEMETEIA